MPHTCAQESLGGNAKTSLILCLSDVRQHADESLQSLQFGARAACVRNKPVVNERLQMRQLTAELLAALEVRQTRGLACGAPRAGLVKSGGATFLGRTRFVICTSSPLFTCCFMRF